MSLSLAGCHGHHSPRTASPPRLPGRSSSAQESFVIPRPHTHPPYPGRGFGSARPRTRPPSPAGSFRHRRPGSVLRRGETRGAVVSPAELEQRRGDAGENRLHLMLSAHSSSSHQRAARDEAAGSRPGVSGGALRPGELPARPVPAPLQAPRAAEPSSPSLSYRGKAVGKATARKKWSKDRNSYPGSKSISEISRLGNRSLSVYSAARCSAKEHCGC